ncbi:hypothetical protein [Eubacterium sp.]|jgi:hypothetical protein|uniref:hypothetical protein n=1 Tax=Eubacterium sp. TaxID=142586 RepID=UPI003A9483B5
MAEPKRGTEVAMIDACLVVMRTKGETEQQLALDTASQVEVAIATETTDAVKLIVKGKLIAQKKAVTTVTGNTLTLTDNVFNFEQAKIIQGGTLYYWTDNDHTSTQTTKTEFGIAGYEPPVAGSAEKGEVFDLDLYSAVYDTSGDIVQYEKISYPNCTGQPFGVGAQDDTFNVNAITIDSAPPKGKAPYSIMTVKELPAIAE